MMNDDIMIGVIAAALIGALLWLASRQRKPVPDSELHAVLNSDEHKVKGRFD